MADLVASKHISKGQGAGSGSRSKGKKMNLTDADRADRLLRMRSKTSKDGKSMPRPEALDAAKLVRTRLNVDETASLRAAFSMFASSKDADRLKTKKLWNVMRALGLAPTPLEFEKLVKDMDKRETGTIKWGDFMKVGCLPPPPTKAHRRSRKCLG